MHLLPLVVALLAGLSAAQGAIGSLRLHADLHREPPIASSAAPFTRTLSHQFLDQRIDNFDPQNYATYQQAYFENDEHFRAGGPLFVYIGGEWTISPESILRGHLFNLAREFNASLFYPEHRYYGISMPFTQLTTENLRFLTVEQALADLASFIVQIKRRNARYADSKVIVVGGSYSATMATWFRKQYPHLAVGAWASSAPVFAKSAFVEYKEIVGAALGSEGSQSCYDTIERGFAQAERIAANETDQFRRAFRLCEDFGGHQWDVAAAFDLAGEVFSGQVQYHMYGTITQTCNRLMALVREHNGNAFLGLAAYVVERLRLEEDECVNSYQDQVAVFRETALNSTAVRSSGRQWFYQTCTEFGWYQSSDSPFQPFGSSFPVELSYALCEDIFGEHLGGRRFVDAAVDRTNVVFGGFGLNVRNVYFTNGMVDPWRAMGVQEDLNEWSPADVIPGASHCNDLQAISELDNEEMLAVKNRVRDLFALWLY